MNKNVAKKLWKWFEIIVIIYVVLGALLYFLQDRLIFHPKKLSADYVYQFDVPFRELNLAVTTNKNLNLVQFIVPDSIRKGIVLYFHGNRGNINRYAEHHKSFTRNGYEVWMMDYPGYGKSTGKRTERALYEDALVVYKLALDQVPVENLVIYGRSLGSGIAAQLASVRDCKRLILETPYYSMGHLATHHFFIYPALALSKYELPTYNYIKYIKAPVTIFHGTKDRLIPYKHAKWLHKKKTGTELITIQKGKHNNLSKHELYQKKMDSLLHL